MRARFGDVYREYCERVPGLVPRLRARRREAQPPAWRGAGGSDRPPAALAARRPSGLGDELAGGRGGASRPPRAPARRPAARRRSRWPRGAAGPFSSECMCTKTGRTSATTSRRVGGVAARRPSRWSRPRGARCRRARVAMPPMRGSSASMPKNSRTSSPWISPITRRPGVMRRALANSAAMSVSSSTARRTQKERSLRAGRSGPRSMATKRSSSEHQLEERVQQRRLAGGAVAEDEQRAAVADELRQLLGLAAGERVAFEQPAQRGGEHAGRADLAGVHHGGGARRAWRGARRSARGRRSPAP